MRYEHRGHGDAPVPPEPYALHDLGADVLALLDRLGLERVHFCGLSLGGMVGMWLAINAPEPPGAARAVLHVGHAGRGSRLGRPGAARARGRQPPPWPRRSSSAGSPRRTPPPHPDLVQRMRAMVGATPAAGYAGCCEAIRTMDLRPALGRASTPTLVIAGAQDPATRPVHAERIAALMPDCRLAVVDAAHLANVEAPDEVTELILGHLLAGDAGDDATRPAVSRVTAGDGEDARGEAGTAAHRELPGSGAGDDDARHEAGKATRHEVLGSGAGDDERHETGMATRRAVLGDAHVDRAVAGTSDFTAPFQDFITRYAWGEVWNRPGLDRRTRSAITLTALTALRAENEIAIHVRGAIANGLTPEEVAEVILHTAVYAGVPAANAAFAIAQETLAELDVPQARPRDRA